MATEKMYDLAFQFKRTKLWKQILESELFAVRLSDGEIGYCCVMGIGGEHIALSLYVGAEGFRSYRELVFRETDMFTEGFSASDAEAAFRQVCLQCSLENKDDIEDWQALEVREYAKAHGISLRGGHSFPSFSKHARYCIPWPIRGGEDERRICEALEAAVALAKLLEGREKADLGIAPVYEDTKTLPLLVPGMLGYNVSRTDAPGEWIPSYEPPAGIDPERVAEIRKLRKKGVYACELFRIPTMIGPDSGAEEAPSLPTLLLCVDTKSGFMVATRPVTDYNARPETLRDMFLDTLVNNKECPRALKVRDEEVRTLLEDFCMKAGILLSVDNELPALDAAREQILGALFGGMDGLAEDDDEDDDGFDFEDDGDDEPDADDMEEAISEAMEQLMNMSDAELKAIPPMVARQVLDMAPFGFVPQELQLRLRRLFKNRI